MTTRVIDFICRHAMLTPGDRVLCAVSGGADSMAMLHILSTLREKLSISLCCAHYNHGIRGDEARRDEEFVRSVCLKMGIPFAAERGNVPQYAAEKKMGIEEAARELRYAFLARCAGEMHCTKIATAHNACDNAETMLLNLLRGSGLKGMGGISPVRGNIIRPVLCLDRAEIEDYIRENSLEFVTDSTNFSHDYTRNRLRHTVMEPLRSLSADFAEKFLRAAESARKDEEYLWSLAESFPREGNAISAFALSELPEPVAARLIMSMAPGASRVHVQTVLALARSENAHGQQHLPGIKVTKQYDKLIFGGEETPAPHEAVLRTDDTVQYGSYTIRCSARDSENAVFRFKTAAICGNITVGPRREGDKISLSHRGVSKTLKKLFSEERIPPGERDRVPVFRDEKGVLAVFGLGQDSRAAAAKGEAALFIEIIDKEG